MPERAFAVVASYIGKTSAFSTEAIEIDRLFLRRISNVVGRFARNHHFFSGTGVPVFAGDDDGNFSGERPHDFKRERAPAR
jgi:hypothetical protein